MMCSTGLWTHLDTYWNAQNVYGRNPQALDSLPFTRLARYNPVLPIAAHWCSWLTRCPLKAEITGSSPVCATTIWRRSLELFSGLFFARTDEFVIAKLLSKVLRFVSQRTRIAASIMQSSMTESIKSVAPILAVSVGILAIITAISIAYFVNWWRLRKSLAYIVKTNTSIFSIEPEIRRKFQILYDGKLITNARLFEITLLNDGRMPVEEKDFSNKTIDFVFSENGQLLSSEVINVNPPDLVIEKEEKENTLSIKPLLLNQGDFFEIKGVINSDDDGITCKARIVGIKEVRRIHPPKPHFSFSVTKIIGSLILLLIAFWIVVFGSTENKSIGLGLMVLLMGYWLSSFRP